MNQLLKNLLNKKRTNKDTVKTDWDTVDTEMDDILKKGGVYVISGENSSETSNEVIENFVAKKLGLKTEKVSTQIIPRDRHASLFSVFFVIFFTFCNTYFFDCFHAIAFTFLFMFAHSNHFFFALAGLMNTKYPIIPIATNIIPKCIETPNTLRKLKHL